MIEIILYLFAVLGVLWSIAIAFFAWVMLTDSLNGGDDE